MNNELMFSSKTDDWETPIDFFNEINKEFYFNFDACASEKNAKCKQYCSKEQDGLAQQWGGEDMVQPAIRKRNWAMG